MIIAFAIFLVVKAMNAAMKEEEEAPDTTAHSGIESFCEWVVSL